MYFKFFKRQYWDKRSVEARRRNCAVLSLVKVSVPPSTCFCSVL